MAGKCQELILQAMQTALGDVADDDDASQRLPSALNRLAACLEPATHAASRDRGELHAERLATRGSLLWRLLGWQWNAVLVLGHQGRHSWSEHAVIGRVGELWRASA